MCGIQRTIRVMQLVVHFDREDLVAYFKKDKCCLARYIDECSGIISKAREVAWDISYAARLKANRPQNDL